MSQTWNHRKDRLRQLLHPDYHDENDLLEDELAQEDADGLALDRLLHGHNVIGPTARTKEIDALKFGDSDLNVLGTLERGQFGVIDVVSCKHTKGSSKKVYIRKTISKVFALRTRHQNSPSTERRLLLRAHQTNTPWAPHLITAFQTTTQLSLVIPYAPLGSLWDLLSSSPLSPMRIRESELKWWVPQMVSAIAWCHSQGYAHRDVKPHNFVVTEEKRIMILDFGSAAPVERVGEGGRQLLSKDHCQVPVGTCDYISPEILKAHEAALVRLELEEEAEDMSSRLGSSRNGSTRGSLRRVSSAAPLVRKEDEVYGIETDWWSMGAMVYEMAYGVTPFFAEDISRTYLKIMDFKRSLRFNAHMDTEISGELKDLLKRAMNDAEFRIGTRNGLCEFKEHRWFAGVDWDNLHTTSPPEILHLPQFVYADDRDQEPSGVEEESSGAHSQGFGFSAFFQSSFTTMPTRNSFAASQGPEVDPGDIEEDPAAEVQDRKRTVAWSSPGLSILHSRSQSSSANDNPWIGFSWGPKFDAFQPSPGTQNEPDPLNTPKPRRVSSSQFLAATPISTRLSTPRLSAQRQFSTPFRTPMPAATPGAFRTPYQTQTLPAFGPGTGGFYTPGPRLATPGAGINTLTRRRPLSDRQAMAKLVDCIGMSARKKVEESGRKCRILNAGFTPAGTAGRGGGADTTKKGFDLKRFASGADFSASGAEDGGRNLPRKSTGSGKKLRFAFENVAAAGKDASGHPDSSLVFSDVNTPRAPPVQRRRSVERSMEDDTDAEMFFQSSISQTRSQNSRHSRSRSLSQSFSLEQPEPATDTETETDLETMTTTSVPPSPSPRPGSTMSGVLLSGANGGWGSYGRSGTPTLTLTFFDKAGRDRLVSSASTSSLRRVSRPDDTTISTSTAGRSLSSTSSYTSVLDAQLDEMSRKHAKMLKDIEMIERRLKSVKE